MRKVRIFTLFLSIILLCSTVFGSFSASAAFTPKFALNSEAVYMVNTDTDIVVVSKNADKKMWPASTTKIMTCLVALENIKNFDAYVLCPYTAFNEFQKEYGNPNYVGPSSAAIEPRQTNITYWDLLYALMVRSGCEAANILAYNIGGESIENFIAMMNAKAKEIGCKNTHFSNAHGLWDENNYTTAYDLYLITKYAIDNYPRFMEICDTYSYDMPANEFNPEGYTITQTNKLMQSTSEYYYEGVHGIKTGSIDCYYPKQPDGSYDYEKVEDGCRTLVTTAEKNGFHYIIVSLGAPYYTEDGTNLSFKDHIDLYDWAFTEFEYTLVIKKNEQITQIGVDKGKDADTVGLIVTEDYYTLLPKSLDHSTIQRICEPITDKLEAPVDKDMEMGNLQLRLNGETLANMKLVTEDYVELDMQEYYKEKVLDFVKDKRFIAIVIGVGLLIVLLTVTSALRKNHNKRVAEMNKRRKISSMPPKKKNNNIRRR